MKRNLFRFQWADKGHLSVRMRIPGNIWTETWHSAKPVPARRQKRLFDDTKEAEKVYFLILLTACIKIKWDSCLKQIKATMIISPFDINYCNQKTTRWRIYGCCCVLQ